MDGSEPRDQKLRALRAQLERLTQLGLRTPPGWTLEERLRAWSEVGAIDDALGRRLAALHRRLRYEGADGDAAPIAALQARLDAIADDAALRARWSALHPPPAAPPPQPTSPEPTPQPAVIATQQASAKTPAKPTATRRPSRSPGWPTEVPPRLLAGGAIGAVLLVAASFVGGWWLGQREEGRAQEEASRDGSRRNRGRWRRRPHRDAITVSARPWLGVVAADKGVKVFRSRWGVQKLVVKLKPKAPRRVTLERSAAGGCAGAALAFSARSQSDGAATLHVVLREGDQDTARSEAIPLAPWQEPTPFTVELAALHADSPEPSAEGCAGAVTLEFSPGRGVLVLEDLRFGEEAMFGQAVVLKHGGEESRGVVAADVGWNDAHDLLVSSSPGPLVFASHDAHYVDRTRWLGIEPAPVRCTLVADLLGDGQNEVFTALRGQPPRLWRRGERRYVQVPLPELPGHNAEGAALLDADGDGRLEVLLTNGEHGNHLLRFDEGAWRDVGESWGLGPSGLGVGNGDYVAVGDIDADGFPDFLYNLDGGVLARNRRTHFERVEMAPRYVTGNSVKLGAAFGDFDNDGDLDLFIPQRERSLLLRNDGDFQWTDASATSGALATLGPGAISGAFADLDADGSLDLVIGVAGEPLRILLGDGRGAFVDATADTGIPRLGDTRDATGLLGVDIDADGDVDLMINRFKASGALFLNTLPPDPSRARLILQAKGRPHGALARVRDTSGAPLGARSMGAVQNFCAQGPAEAFFSLPPGPYDIEVLSGETTLTRRVELGPGVTVFDIAKPPR